MSDYPRFFWKPATAPTTCGRCEKKVPAGAHVRIVELPPEGGGRVFAPESAGCYACVTDAERAAFIAGGGVEKGAMPRSGAAFRERMSNFEQAAQIIAADSGCRANAAAAATTVEALLSAAGALALGDGSLAQCSPDSWQRALRLMCVYGLPPGKERTSQAYLFTRTRTAVEYSPTHRGLTTYLLRKGVIAEPPKSVVVWPYQITLGEIVRLLRARGEHADDLRAAGREWVEQVKRDLAGRADKDLTADQRALRDCLATPAYLGRKWVQVGEDGEIVAYDVPLAGHTLPSPDREKPAGVALKCKLPSGATVRVFLDADGIERRALQGTAVRASDGWLRGTEKAIAWNFAAEMMHKTVILYAVARGLLPLEAPEVVAALGATDAGVIDAEEGPTVSNRDELYRAMKAEPRMIEANDQPVEDWSAYTDADYAPVGAGAEDEVGR